MNRRHSITLALAGVLPMLGMLVYELPVSGQTPAAPVALTAPAGDSFSTALMRVEITKAQIQVALSEKIALLRAAKLKVVKTQKEAGTVDSSALADAQIESDQAQAGAEIAKLNLEVIQIQLNETISHAAGEPKPTATPTDLAILKIEMSKAQIQLATAQKNLETRNADLQSQQETSRKAPDLAKMIDTQIEVEMAGAAVETSKLDLSALQLRRNAITPGQ